MNEGQGNELSLGVEQYIFVLKRQWRVVLAATMLGAIVAAGVLLFAPRTVTATTTVTLNAITTEPFSAQRATSGLLDDATETAIARSHVVAARASEALNGSMTASEIRAASTVSTASGAAVVTVDFEADSLASAIEGADAVANAYLTFRSEQADQRIDVMVTNLTERITALNETLNGVNTALASAESGSVAYAQAATQQQQILTELDGLLSERNGLQSVDTTGGIVLTAAADNLPAYSPGRTITLLTGLAGGLVLGIIAAFIWNPFDRRLRDASEMVRALGAPVFATIDPARGRVPARGADAEALRVARERLLSEIHLGDAVLVLDVTHRDEASTAGANLAAVTALAGYDVQLIVPEASAEQLERLESSNALVDGLTIIATEAEGEHHGDLLITQEIVDAVHGAEDDTLTFIVLSAEAHPASILAALRISHATMLVLGEKASTVPEVRWLSEEASIGDAPMLGAVVERRLRAR